uniref:Protein ZBED8like [Pundamilia nyererei] n=1 Tax=Lepeophtheirus salmonis TaxID=72036 RepID=A0A0K2UHY7_LEPSM
MHCSGVSIIEAEENLEAFKKGTFVETTSRE